MRPLRLDAEGFGTFRDPVTLDFSDSDYFALVGPTGSGKTTVIDAICFALYGSAPRWSGKGQVSLAMAPSTSHTRVALTFEVSGRNYAAVRVLARAAGGNVTTKQSRLITLPSDLVLDDELDVILDQEAESLAEGPADMEDAIQQLLGLSYEHFTQSVVLPQGRFAQFLHAPKGSRQDLLVSLLGLGIYDRVKQRANALAEVAKTRAATLTEQLDKYDNDTELAEEHAVARLAAITDFERRLDTFLTPWRAARQQLEKELEESAGVDESLGLLKQIRRPADLDDLASQHSTATGAASEAEESESLANQAEAEAEDAVQGVGEASVWRQLIEQHEQLASLSEQSSSVGEAVTAADAKLDAATSALESAKDDLDHAVAELDEIRIAHQADDLATTLAAGAECPVCRQVVPAVPERPPHEGLREAEARVDAARQDHHAADKNRRTAERAHERAVDDAERLGKQVAELETQLECQPDAATARLSYQGAQEAAAVLKSARQSARQARDAARTARETAQAVGERWAETGRQLVTVRDGVAHLGPPPTAGDPAEDWKALEQWAVDRSAKLAAQVAEAATRCEEAQNEEFQERTAVQTALKDLEIDLTGDLTDVTVRTAVATDRTGAERDLVRIRERREEAAQLEKEIAEQETSARLDRELGNLLSARNFERWMVEETLRAMLIEASATLSELSGGQFELALDNRQDIQVVDHNDASSVRPVQTLSGGETFQASLALALALGSQIRALAPTTGQLDTMLLDEGFGTLDPSTLDVVVSSLEQLVGGGERTVGVVTHVGALAERVPVRFEVQREGSRSTVRKVWA